MTKQKPTTPLPIKTIQKPRDTNYCLCTCSGFEEIITGGIRFKKDAEYYAHAANAYPKLVEALRVIAQSARGEFAGDLVTARRYAEALLRELEEGS